jgi:hypothetical protein
MLLGLGGSLPALADIQGGCKAWAVGSQSGSVNLTGANELHLRQDDVLAVQGFAPNAQTHVTLTVYIFGFGVTLPDIGGFTENADSQSHLQVSSYSKYARVVSFAAATNDCSGSLLVSVDDLSPVRNVAGGVGAVLGLLGLLGVLLAARGRGRFGGRLGGGFCGLLAGTGIGILLQQMLWIDPRSSAGLAAPIAGLVLGVLLAGSQRRAAPPAPPESGPPPEAPAAPAAVEAPAQ